MRNNSIRPTFVRVKSACVIVILGIWSLSSSTDFSFGGYVEDLPIVLLPPGSGASASINNLFQSRLNMKCFPWSPVIIDAEGRLLWYGGKDFTEAGAIAAQMKNDPGYLGLGWAQGKNGTPLVLYENIDRLSVGLTEGKFTGTLGRLRINWGTNLVWNPNDWFNAFNYLDFAYPERPGTDALRIQYYTSSTSVAELALQAGPNQSGRTFAALYKLNRWAYDWQFQAGLSGNDAAAGFSWSGSIKGGGFRGELACYYPVIDSPPSGCIKTVAAVSGDYTFPSSLYLHVEALYNGFGATDSSTEALSTTSRLTAKSLLPKRYALFGETAYQLNPLFRLDCAASVSPTDGSFFIAPTITLSLLDDLDLFALGRVFHGKSGDLYGGVPALFTVSMKWSF
jgi:hypothetical protein